MKRNENLILEGIPIESSHIHSQGLVNEIQFVVPVPLPNHQNDKEHYCRNQAWDGFDPAPVEPSIQLNMSCSILVS